MGTTDEAFDKLNNFFSGFKKLSYKKGETIYRAGDELRHIFYLIRGYVKLYSLSKNAQALTLIIYKPGDIFPLIPSINQTTVAYFAEAMTPLELYRAPLAQFRDFIHDNNDVLFELTSRILTRFGGVLTRMEYAMFGNTLNKISSIILICADRFGIKDKGQTVIQVPLTHQDIANLLGVARETVSIEMKKLKEKGLISNQGKCLVVKSSTGLQKESLLNEYIP